jgi:membrane-associated HD superfamily phosphohydrolase
MEIATLIIAIMGLALAGLAWWRAGGRRDLEALRAKQKELTDALLYVIEELYEESRQSLRQTADGFHQLKTEAIAELDQQLDRATHQLQQLERRLEEGLKSVRDSAMVTAHSVERGLRRRVRRIEARGSLLYAKASDVLAVRWLRKQEFDRAEKRLDEATALLALARETMRADHAYDEQFDIVKRTLADAITAVREKSADSISRIERVIAETDKLLNALETDETEAAREPQQEQEERKKAA